MSKSRFKKGGNSGRDAGGFVAMPWAVLDSVAYGRLSHPARSLLWEFARQYAPGNNGRLLASAAYLSKRGWTSSDVITRAKRELLEAGFIFETVKGRRPNRAAWFALTFFSLDRIAGFDDGAAEGFRRGAYRDADPLPKPKPTRDELYRKWDTKNASLRPSHGVERAAIAPSHGVEGSLPTPSHGAIRPIFDESPTPSAGNLLETPSPPAFLCTDSEHGRYLRLRRGPRNLFTGLLAATVH